MGDDNATTTNNTTVTSTYNADDRTTIGQHHLDLVLTNEDERQQQNSGIPDGGYGWIIFVATLFFQALIPSIHISFGIFLAFQELETIEPEKTVWRLWDENLVYAPCFFIASWTFFDPLSTKLLTYSTWPRLVLSAGNCLTCAGLLFVWFGLTAANGNVDFIVAGIFAGMGASIQITQCELILSQYFRFKLAFLQQITQFISALGFMIVPIVLGHHIINVSLLHIILWYLAIILQGLIVNIVMKKPQYLKTKQTAYRFVSTNNDEEEDIFSRNARELQIKRQTSHGPDVETIRIENAADGPSRQWVRFGDEDEPKPKAQRWETFDEEPRVSESAAAEEATAIPQPTPLFTESDVNYNTTYAYDDGPTSASASVFAPNERRSAWFSEHIELLRQPTFYKSLLLLVTMKYSIFLFFTLLPNYLYLEIDSFNIRRMSTVVGSLSTISLVFALVSYWINIDKERRAVFLWLSSWVGAIGYLMMSEWRNEYVIIIGAGQVLLSINTLKYVENPLMGIKIRGEESVKHKLLCFLSSLSFLLFLFINFRYRDCFRMMSALHFITGNVWLLNFAYKRLGKFW